MLSLSSRTPAALLPSPRCLALGALLLAALAGCRSSASSVTELDPPIRVPDFASGEGAHHPFRLSDQRGKVVVVSFGYTSCPDICPTTLARLLGMKRALAGRGGAVETVFVSVDPARDTTERLEDYVTAFDPSFRAARLEGIALARVLAAFGITVRRHEMDLRRYSQRPANQDGYTIDHTGGYFLVDPQGLLRLRLPHDSSAEALAKAAVSLLPDAPPQPIRVEAARLRRTPAGVGAIYLRLINQGRADDVLVSAASESATAVELHEVVPTDGMLRMIPRPEGFALPANAMVELSPGGKHLMLFGVPEVTSLPLTLTFRNAGAVRVQVPALGLAESEP